MSLLSPLIHSMFCSILASLLLPPSSFPQGTNSITSILINCGVSLVLRLPDYLAILSRVNNSLLKGLLSWNTLGFFIIRWPIPFSLLSGYSSSTRLLHLCVPQNSIYGFALLTSTSHYN